MSARKATAQPECTDECRRLKRLKASVAVEIARMQKTTALLVAVHYAANHGCDDFVVSDALAAILLRCEQHIATLDQRMTEAMS